MFSIDQNCHSLWDTLPKLQALVEAGHRVRHFIEDIDVAFTSVGSSIEGDQLRLERERFHRSGGADWGAALFYSEFLGRLPVEIRDWEPLTGMRTNVLAKKLDRTVDELFEEFSPGDNWQLIGPSYAGDRDHHRLIGDLTVAETAPFLRQIVEKAKADTLRAFPQADSQARLKEWFGKEQGRLERLIERFTDGRLVDVYRGWLAEYLGGSVELDLTSNLFAVGSDRRMAALLEVFLSDYDLAAGLYNEAVEETGVKLRPLKTADGELPFFAVLQHQGHLVRTGAYLRGGEMVIEQRGFRLEPGGPLPFEQLKAAGVRCLSGKAVLLVIQVRLDGPGEPLALPYRGSLYIPAADHLAGAFCRHGLLPARLHPVVRVRFHLLDRLRSLETLIRLPAHLAPCFGKDEIPARQLGEAWADLAAQARQRLETIRDPADRQKWQRQNFPKLWAQIEELDKRRRELAGKNPKSEEIRGLWKQAKSLTIELLDRTVRQIARDDQVRNIDYWDSRGALLPWGIALGGEGFYRELVAKAEIHEEPPPQGCGRRQERGHPDSL